MATFSRFSKEKRELLFKQMMVSFEYDMNVVSSTKTGREVEITLKQKEFLLSLLSMPNSLEAKKILADKLLIDLDTGYSLPGYSKSSPYNRFK